MKKKKVFLYLMTVIMLLSMTVGVALAEDGDLFRKNISKTPDNETEKANIMMMDFYVPAQSAAGLVGAVDNYLLADEATVAYEPRDFAKPLISVWIDDLTHELEAKGGISFGMFDAFVGVSLDDGTSWKTTNLSRSADLSSFFLSTTGEAYPGDVHNVVHQVAGDNIFVAWVSKYCDGGTPLYTLDPTEDAVYLGDLESTYSKDAIYLYDLFGVAGAQGSVDYELQGFPEIGEIPYSCVWTDRGKLIADDDPATTDVTEDTYVMWAKPERLTSGKRDANLPAVDCAGGAGCIVTWQEDPEGLRPGQGLGPGEGWSGAIANAKTDIWYSYIGFDDFDDVFAAEDTVGAIPMTEYALLTDATMPKSYVPMAMPSRLTDNNMCRSINSDPYCYIDFDSLDDIDHTNIQPLLDLNGPEADADFCDEVVSWTTPGDAELQICKTDDGRILNGRVASTRVRLNLKPYTKADGTKSAFLNMAYEETKALGDIIDEFEDPIDIGKDVWYHSFDMFDHDFVAQGGILNQPAMDRTLETPVFFPIEVDEWGNEYYLTEIARRFALTTNSVQAAIDSDSGLSAMLIYKQGIINQGGPADIFLRRVLFEPQYEPVEDLDGDGKWDLVNEDLDGDGKLDLVNEDLDSDGKLDQGEDLDFDGNLDVVEDVDGDGHLDMVAEDVDNDGVLDLTEDLNANTILDVGEDLDGDGYADFISEDLDLDGNLDVVEIDLNEDGIVDPEEDIDGDGKFDLVNEDLDDDGKLDQGEDLDFDGNLDVAEDVDGDGILDLVAEDVDNDGVLDLTEDLNANTIFDQGEDLDGDGIADFNSEDIDLDGNLDVFEDSDGDGNLDVIEIDLDDDGILDSGEWIVENPYAYENMECDEWVYTDGDNPNYLKGLCLSPAINISGTTIETCSVGSDNDSCADAFPVDDDGSIPDTEVDFPKVTVWRQCDGTSAIEGCEDDNDLDDQSWDNPYDVAKGHRGFLDGDIVMMMYAWAPNWKSNSVGNDHYNLYIRRSFDGGATWTTTPADLGGAGITVTENYYGTTIGTVVPQEWTYAAGAFEQARNVSLLTGNQVTILDPRYTPSGGLKLYPTIRTDWLTDNGFSADGLPYLDDLTRASDKFFVVYETGDNTTVAEGEAVPLDLYYSRGTIYGDVYETMDYPTDTDDALLDRWPWLENQTDDLSGEAGVVANPGGTFMYAVWNQWKEEIGDDGHELIFDSDIIFRRLLYLPDDSTLSVAPTVSFLYTGEVMYSVEDDDTITLIITARDLDKLGEGEDITEYEWIFSTPDGYEQRMMDCTGKVCNVPARTLSEGWDGYGSSGGVGWAEMSVRVKDNDPNQEQPELMGNWSNQIKTSLLLAQTIYKVQLPFLTR